MRTSDEWLSYFRANADRPPPPEIGREAGAIEPRLRAALVRSLGRFYLGEAGEGRVAHEAARSRDPALDGAMRECIALYVREEGRHARALASAITALGSPLPKRHYSEALFRRGRRLMGLRTKLLTIAAAEVVGLAYYGLLADHVPALAPLTRDIARDEQQHLAFVADYFTRVVATGSGSPSLRRAALATAFAAVVSCAVVTVLVDHAPLLDALGVTRTELCARCVAAATSPKGAIPRAPQTPSAEASSLQSAESAPPASMVLASVHLPGDPPVQTQTHPLLPGSSGTLVLPYPLHAQ